MIENDELGLKVAKDKKEELWINIKERAERSILQSEAEKEIQEEILKLCEKKIKVEK